MLSKVFSNLNDSLILLLAERDALVWQGETSRGIARGQLCSLGRWRLCLSATPRHQTPKTIKHQTDLLLPLSLVLCTTRQSNLGSISGCYLLTNPVRSYRLCQCCCQNQTLKLQSPEAFSPFLCIRTSVSFLTVQNELHFTQPVVVSGSMMMLIS